MIVDTSAILALAFGEPNASLIFDTLAGPEEKRISAANLFETFAVVDRRGDVEAVRLVEELIARFGMKIEPVTVEQVWIARNAWNQFGRGTGHPSRLNFGDCFAYALAYERAESLLFIGNDFLYTDVRSAI